MIARLVSFGVAALTVTTICGAAFYLWSAPREVTPASRAASTLVRMLENGARESGKITPTGWAVTSANSAHDVLVVHVEAERLDEASRIAVEIVEPVLSRGYDEVLVYVHDAGDDPTVRRIQWTLRGGYVESSFVDQ